MVDLVATDEQQQIANSVAEYLRAELPLDRLTKKGKANSDTDHAKWKAMAELGWFGLGLPEEQGGIGYSEVEEAFLYREMGRLLVTPSAIAASLGARVAAGAGNGELAAAIISGEVRPAITIATSVGEVGPRVSGRYQLFDGAEADLALFLSADGAALVERRALNDLKVSRSGDDALSLELADLNGAPTVAYVGADAGIRRNGLLLAAAMLAGMCEATRDMASAYAKIREQFGQPIGKFQAVKHKCADMAIRADAVNALVAFASITVRDRRADADFQVAAAKLLGAQYALLNAKENIQVHGAIGFTTDLPAHLFLKRAHVLDHFGGAVRRQQMDLLAQPAA
ncbi:MAG: uncharacterized protein JWP35_1182 [Caulobacter sp.]|nr:uncharacterized protein [Caulobacter sp.]